MSDGLSKLLALNWQPADYIQLVTSIITFIAVAVSVVTFSKQINRQRIISAVDIGLKIEELVEKWAYIDYVLMESNLELYQFLSETDSRKMKRFESDEIDEVYSQAELQWISTLFFNDEFNSHYNGGPALVFNVSPKSVEKANKRFPKIVEDYHVDEEDLDQLLIFQKVIIKTLNQMETLCMMMIEEVADESVAYNMINSSFIHYVKVFYYYIASTNDSSFLRDNLINSKKMKHVILVFNKWEKRRRRNLYLIKVRKRMADILCLKSFRR